MTENSPATAANAAQSPELGLTMTRVLRNPLAALRAQMESLAGEFRADDPRQTRLRGALEQVLKLSRDVDAISQFASPRALAPIECTFDEILQTAVRGLRFEQRSRVQVALASPSSTLVVDGPVLASCLAHLIENAVAQSDGWVLLSAREEDGCANFAVVEDAGQAAQNGEPAAALPEHRSTALQLGLWLARREVERMGGSLRVTYTALGHACALVTFPVPASPRG